ncbi:MAG: hypothetical protein LBU04_03340 [Christensenellaceae bacterium]|nr:hypothetical protein [Christensenellaceae bacterium]
MNNFPDTESEYIRLEKFREEEENAGYIQKCIEDRDNIKTAISDLELSMADMMSALINAEGLLDGNVLVPNIKLYINGLSRLIDSLSADLGI